MEDHPYFKRKYAKEYAEVEWRKQEFKFLQSVRHPKESRPADAPVEEVLRDILQE
jgi:hypothetical protein